MGVDLFCVALCFFQVKRHIGKQVQFIDDAEMCGLKHIRVFERFIFAFRHAENYNPKAFAQIEEGGADEVADILDGYDTVFAGFELVNCMVDHSSIQVAAFTGIDLNDRGFGCCDACGVVGSLLVSFDYKEGDLAF